MIEISCPRCDEPNPVFAKDLNFRPSDDCKKLRARTECISCDTPLTISVRLSINYEQKPYLAIRKTQAARKV